MLLVFADDWGRHPSSCQHLVRHLLPDHRVAWVNTIGTRPPRLNLATLRRGLEKLRHWSRPVVTATHNNARGPNVISPRMWPWFTRRHDRWLNAQMLTKALKPIVAQAEEPVYAVTTIPIVADLMGRLPVERWTYYCVDDFSEWPGLDRVAMETMERDVVEQADEIIAVSETLRNRLRGFGRNTHFLPHGVDLDHWRSSSPGVLPELHGLASPLIVFWGVVDRRMDTAWVHHLARSIPSATILLVGPLDNPHDDLFSLPNIRHLPPLPYERLPALGQQADVLIMPYADLPVTRAMQPLKLKEYLATGKPVVVRSLPAVEAWGDCLDVASSAEHFSALVQSRLQHKIPPSQIVARQRLKEESWAAKAQHFEAWIVGRAEGTCNSSTSEQHAVAISH